MPLAVFLAGVSCVGKTTIGARLAARIGYRCYDLDSEVEAHFGQPIEHLKAQTLTPHGFRAKFASVVLRKLLAIRRETGIVIALPPSGLKDCLYAIIRRVDCAVIGLIMPRVRKLRGPGRRGIPGNHAIPAGLLS